MARTQSTAMAVTYARSLLELATAQNEAEPIGQDLEGLRQILEGEPVFLEFLKDPAIGKTRRAEALDRVFLNRVSPLMMRFLDTLNRHGRIGQLDEIAAAYSDLLDEQLSKVEVDVTVARRLSPDDLEVVRQRVGRSLGREAVIHQYVDESILGGMVLRVQDRLIDASVRHQLQAMKKRLMNAAPARP